MATIVQKSGFSVGNTRIDVVMQGVFSKQGSYHDVHMHNHPNLELHYITNGSLCLTAGDTEQRLGKDTLVLIPPRLYHAFSGSTEDMERISFEIKLSKKKDGADTFTEYTSLLGALDSPIRHCGNLPEFISLASCMGIISGEEALCRTNANFTIVFLKICDILRSDKTPPERSSENSSALIPTYDEDMTVIAILDHINRHFRSPMRLSEVAKAVSLSERQVQRILASKMNESFHALLCRRRITAAKALLSDTSEHRSLEEIAFECGFSNYVSFWKQFKSFTGQTPEQFRKRK